IFHEVATLLNLFLENFRYRDQPLCLECAAALPGEALSGEEGELADLRGRIREELDRRLAEVRVERVIRKQKKRQDRLGEFGLSIRDFRKIPAGKFLMGSPPEEKDRFDTEQQHEVQIDNFEMLATPVTFEMFDIFCEAIGMTKPHDEKWGRENRPVINVTYWAAMEYCYWLQKRTGWSLRLPTEAEWEYACRAGTATPFWTGETITTEQANFNGDFTYHGSKRGSNRGRTTPVDLFEPNPWGLRDMHGNVWEWTASLWDDTYHGQELENEGDNRDNLEARSVRGGSWYNVPGSLRSASRNKLMPNYHYLKVGFRIVREID
ncbi:MAG: hypothetical protein B0D89_02805, partial [Candidatus Sedimenticola endophacoides]